MRRHLSVDTVRVTLMTALGLLGGCGGIAQTHATSDASQEATGGGGDDASMDGLPDVADGSAPGPDVTEELAPGPDVNPSSCRFACQDPMPVVLNGVDTGYDSCAGGYMRRRAQATCPTFLPRPGNGVCAVFDGGAGECNSDSDCASDPLGHCEAWAADGGLPQTCACIHGCRVDTDCSAGEVCLCGTPIGQCVPATCSTGASCAAGCDCISSSAGSGCGPQYDCQTPQDECASPMNCEAGQVECADYGGRHTCQGYNYCGVGRPFLVDGAPRLASTTARADWSDRRLSPDTSGLSPSARWSLADHWTRTALMEHASVAAFARFTLQLLALGAPSALVAASSQAMADETEHARMAFALASAYEGRDVGPDALPIDGSLDGADLDSFVATLLREGCIGETSAAVEAREMLGVTRDPVVRDVLEKIARDETRHAELAWQTLAWLLSSGRARASQVHRELESALSEMEPGDGGKELADEVAARIIRPCADALTAAA
jgi:hypothetical protein